MDSANATDLLWDNPDGSISLWKINTNGTVALQQSFGPYSGWTAKSVAVGANAVPRILWTNADGRMTLWSLADPAPTSTCALYGPYPGWTVASLSIGGNNIPRIFWNYTDQSLSLWNTSDAIPSNTCALYGPFAGWTAVALAVGTNNIPRILWDNTDGRISLWNTADAVPSNTCLIYGPYSGWTGTALAAGPNNVPRILWVNTDGRAAVWNTSDPQPSQTALVFSPPSGFHAAGLAVGPDNLAHLLWSRSDGAAQIWTLNAAVAGGIAASAVFPQTPPASLTQAQAITRAQLFCQTIGASVTAPATAVFPAPNRYTSQQDTYWQPRWRVTFGSQAEVDVVAATGVISHFYNFALSQQLLSVNSPAGSPITPAAASQIAASVLQASGQLTSELAATPTSQNFQLTDPPTQAGDLWMLTWGRQVGFAGIPYRHEQATLMLQAETGQVQAFSLTFPAPPPSTGAGGVTSVSAISTAQSVLTGAGVTGTTQQSATLQVVQPNTYWQSGGSATPPPNEAGQIAWNVVFTNANNTVYEVWVDSNLGTVIGGESYGIAGMRHSRLPSKAAARRKPASLKASMHPIVSKHTRKTAAGRK